MKRENITQQKIKNYHLRYCPWWHCPEEAHSEAFGSPCHWLSDRPQNKEGIRIEFIF